MPIAKYIQNLYPVGPPPPPPPDVPTVGGGGWLPDDTFNSFDHILSNDEAFAASLLAWELGDDEFNPGQPIGMDQFTWRAFNLSGEAGPSKLSQVVATIDEGRALSNRERNIRIAKYTVIIGGVTYVLYRIAFILI